FSDRTQQFIGNRFPFIALGVILSSALFITLPTIAILGNPQQVWRWLLPGFAVAWAIAMTMFRSPAMALLWQAVPRQKFPQATGILIFVSGLIGAFKPIIQDNILKLGSAFTFTIGSFTLLGAAFFLRRLYPPQPPQQDEVTPQQLQHLSFAKLGFVCLAGIGIAWGLRSLLPTVAAALTRNLGESQTNSGMFIFSIILAFASIPGGIFASRVGNSSAMLIGLGVTTILLPILAFAPNFFLVAIALLILTFVFSLVLNGTIPLALSSVPPSRGGLGIGTYFGGFGAGMSLFSIMAGQVELTTIGQVVIGAISFLLAGVSISMMPNGNGKPYND
ncbi:MAG: hypothetical protein WA896_01810, partial [Spirulinaceae cyanobacterium]